MEHEATYLHENNPGEIWMATASRWCPADGRIVPGSLFEKLASQSRVPDLRGMFLRGLNIMETTPQVPLDARRKDPEDRTPGSFQPDLFKEHNHELTDPGHFHPFNTREARGGGAGNPPIASDNAGAVSGINGGSKLTGITIAKVGDVETRPKNIAVYYYIRIN